MALEEVNDILQARVVKLDAELEAIMCDMEEHHSLSLLVSLLRVKFANLKVDYSGSEYYEQARKAIASLTGEIATLLQDKEYGVGFAEAVSAHEELATLYGLLVGYLLKFDKTG